MGDLENENKISNNTKEKIMKRIKSIKSLFFILMVFYFSSTFYGCLAQRENISDKQKLIEQIKQSCDNYDQTVNISANPLAQNASLSAVYPLNIQIHDDNIYVFNIMYKKFLLFSFKNIFLNLLYFQSMHLIGRYIN